jgi:hypothetical protein
LRSFSKGRGKDQIDKMRYSEEGFYRSLFAIATEKNLFEVEKITSVIKARNFFSFSIILLVIFLR